MKIVHFLKALPQNEKFVFRKHFIYSLLDGVILGVLALNEFVLIKSLHGSNFQIGLLVQFTTLAFLVSVIINEILKRVLDKKRFIRFAAIVTRFPLLIIAFFPQSHDAASAGIVFQHIFLSIFFVYYLNDSLLLPVINMILRSNYTRDNFGYLYSFATSANKVVMLLVTFFYGILLDENNFAFVYMYPLAGLSGIISVYMLTQIPLKQEIKRYKSSLWTALKGSVVEMWLILKKNKPYRDFQISFMLYGFAFLITQAIITIFYEKELKLNYSSVAFYKNAYYIIAIVLMPYFGKLINKLDPRKFGAITFLFMLFYLLFIGLTEFFPYSFEFMGIRFYYTLVIAFLFNAIFAATMSLVWYIGSAYFAQNDDVATYQSIHISLTGIRGMLIPLIGVALLDYIHYSGIFLSGVILLAIAIWVMLWSMRRYAKS